LVANQKGSVARMPKVLPDAAYKIFAGPGLMTMGNKVASHKRVASIFIDYLKH